MWSFWLLWEKRSHGWRKEQRTPTAGRTSVATSSRGATCGPPSSWSQRTQDEPSLRWEGGIQQQVVFINNNQITRVTKSTMYLWLGNNNHLKQSILTFTLTFTVSNTIPVQQQITPCFPDRFLLGFHTVRVCWWHIWPSFFRNAFCTCHHLEGYFYWVKKSGSWRNRWVVKRACCSSREPPFSSSPTEGCLQTPLLQGSEALFWP